jgi:uncharacterized protein (DUF169 family)
MEDCRVTINKDYARRLKEHGYARKAIAFKLCDDIPAYAEPYGDDASFHCAVTAELWEEGKKPVYITNSNILCGGAVYSGLGNRKIGKEEFDGGMEQTIGLQRGYATRQVFRRVNQQMQHVFKTHTYQVIGSLEDVEDPDVVMIVADARKVQRLCKAYTWETGELVYGTSGTAWCNSAFPPVLKTKTMTFTMGDEQSRILMQLEDGDMFCMIHYAVLPLVIKNLDNIQTGLVT